VTPIPIVENFDVFKDIQSGLISGDKVAVKGQFCFEGSEESFYGGIVITVALAAHTIDHLMLCQQCLIIVAGILAAPILMISIPVRVDGPLWPCAAHQASFDDAGYHSWPSRQ